MATHIVDRCTYWIRSKGEQPNNYGDYRFYWKVYYETDKANRRTKIIVDYYRQTHCTDYVESQTPTSLPSGTSTAYINGSSIGALTASYINGLYYGDNKKLTYLGSKSAYVYHNDDGSASFKFKANGYGFGISETTYSTAAGHFASIPSPSLMGTVDTFNIDNGVSIPVTKYVSSYYDVLEISSGEFTKTIENATKDFVVKTSTPISITFTEEELDDIYTKIPTGENTNFTIKLTTYSSSDKTKTIGTSSKTVVGNFTILLPTVNGAICTDINTDMLRLTGDETMKTIVNIWSHLQVSIPPEIAAVANTRKANIVRYIVDGVVGDFSEEGTIIDRGYWKFGKDNITIYAVDSRGTSSLPYVQKFDNYIDYKWIGINTKNYTIGRQDNGVGKIIEISFEGTWWDGNFGAVQNSLTPFVYYRVNEGQTWNDLNEFVDGASIGRIKEDLVDMSTTGVFKYNGPIISAEADGGFDPKNSYDIFIGFMDELSNQGLTITAPYGTPAGAIFKNKMALGGPYDEQLGGTQLWGDVYLNGEPVSGGDTLPIGAIVDYDGDTVPDGYEIVAEPTYSTEEQKTGETWKDGRPIYVKVVTLTKGVDFTSNNASVNHNIANINEVTDLRVMSLDKNTGLYRPLPWAYYTTQSDSKYYGGIAVDKTRFKLEIGTTFYSDSSLSFDITIKYTKTTD